jgi:glutamyl-tRNA synthetase
VREAVIEIGMGETDISFSWENLYAHNRAVVDPVANRYFFVPDPVEITIEGAPNQTAHALLHPAHPERGTRELHFTGKALIPQNEVREQTGMVRLKDLFNVEIRMEGRSPVCRYAGESLSEARARKAPIIQWLPPEECVPATLLIPGETIKGVCERRVTREAGAVVQFERIGFARIDSVEGGEITAYFAHR